MNRIPESLVVAIATVALAACGTGMNEADLYLGQRPPGTTPEIFAPGIISTANYEHSPAVFSPDLKSVYWTFEKQNPTQGIIKYSTFQDGAWTDPAPTSFGADFTNDTPYLTRDGNTLFFCSKRPIDGTDLGWHLWFVTRDGDDWSTPTPLGLQEIMPFSGYLTIAEDGVVVFSGRGVDEDDPRDVFTARFQSGRCSEPVRLSAVNSKFVDGYPNISRDGSFLIFESDRPGGLGGLDLYFSRRDENGGWSEPKNLGAPLNSSADDRYGQLSPDGRYLFFGSDRGENMDVYWVDAKILADQPSFESGV